LWYQARSTSGAGGTATGDAATGSEAAKGCTAAGADAAPVKASAPCACAHATHVKKNNTLAKSHFDLIRCISIPFVNHQQH
jgi:hypothetical protein